MLVLPLGVSGKWALSLDYGPRVNARFGLFSQASHHLVQFLLLLGVELRSGLPLPHSRTDMATPTHTGQFLRTSLPVSDHLLEGLESAFQNCSSPVNQVGLVPPR